MEPLGWMLAEEEAKKPRQKHDKARADGDWQQESKT
jgi:hypothetical protein